MMVPEQSVTLIMSRLSIRTVSVEAGRTTMRLEPEIWSALDEICRRERLSLSQLVRRVDVQGRRTSSVRIYTLPYFRVAATEEGHQRAGHGSLPAE